MITLLNHYGIIHDRTPPYSNESNGIAERYNRTIITAAHSMLIGLPLTLWAEAIATAVYLRNRLSNRSIGKSTPYESLYHKKPSINHLRPYGTKVFVHLPEEKRLPGTKLMPRAIEGYLIGYTSSNKIYRIYIPSQHKVSETRQIHWTTKTITLLGPTAMEPLITEESYVKVKPISSPLALTFDGKPIKQEPGVTTTKSTFQTTMKKPSLAVPEPPRKSGGISNRPTISYKGQQARTASSIIPDEDPTTYNQAIKSSLKDQWTLAMDDEINALKKNKTFEVIDKPIGRNIDESKWVFKTKKNADGTLERFRARAVAQGFSQAPSFDFEDTFAPVIRYEFLRLLIAICARNKWRSRQFDVKSAFLYGKLKEEVYMRPPPGFSDGDKVWKLNRCIHGLKQSANE